jgi:plastocyanin
MLSKVFATALLALGVNAASHSIDVGENGIKFDPETTTAAIGDT